MSNTFLQFDKVTGEFLGVRRTSKQIPQWTPDLVGRRIELVPKEVRENPEEFKMSKNGIVRLNKKELEEKKKKESRITNKLKMLQ